MNQKIFKWLGLFFLSGVFFTSNLYAVKIFGFGDKDFDVSFVGTPISAHKLMPGEAVDAITKGVEPYSDMDVVVFQINRVMIGEFPKIKRGGPSRFDQAQEALQEKRILDVVGLNFKDPNQEMDRETIRIAVEDAGQSFGITVGEPMQYFQHKIYLKQMSKKSKTYYFVKSTPILKK